MQVFEKQAPKGLATQLPPVEHVTHIDRPLTTGSGSEEINFSVHNEEQDIYCDHAVQ